MSLCSLLNLSSQMLSAKPAASQGPGVGRLAVMGGILGCGSGFVSVGRSAVIPITPRTGGLQMAVGQYLWTRPTLGVSTSEPGPRRGSVPLNPAHTGSVPLNPAHTVGQYLWTRPTQWVSTSEPGPHSGSVPLDPAHTVGNSCQSAVLSTLMRSALPTATPSLDIKPYLPFPLDSTSVRLFPDFSTIDPVQKAIIGQTFSPAPLPPLRKPLVCCSVCQLKFNSEVTLKLSIENQASAHFKGTKHARKLRCLDPPDARRKPAADAIPQLELQYCQPLLLPLGRRCRAAACQQGQSRPVTARRRPNGAVLGRRTQGRVQGRRRRRRRRRPNGCYTAPSARWPSTPPLSWRPTTAVSHQPASVPAAHVIILHLSSTDCVTILCLSTTDRVIILCLSTADRVIILSHLSWCTKHKTMLDARSGAGTITSFPRPGVKGRLAPPTSSATGLQNKTFYCKICDVHVNSETQLKQVGATATPLDTVPVGRQHISSRRHKDRAAGKPAKPKYSPYSKSSRIANTLTGCQMPLKLAKPLAAQLLPGHLAAAGVAPISLGSTPAVAAALFQTRPLHQALLRPAPGPLRTSHASVLFAPY
ncbi:hypothetical protein JZ751_016648 [Albula glossodonta]|uniref:C2H2-type domain-containing protein n=1 Tax=Albula glossodonta TaxID=121402 RepID=A0A8T2N1Y0_9TELE|nr:hypothetical protein JZ751_016648 [Albula glossodonta]